MKRPVNRLRGIALAVLALGGVACDASLNTSATPTLSYTEDARAAYEEAMDSYREKDWESARALFTEVKKLFPQSRFARLAELRIADIDFAQDKFTEAIGSYRTFVTNHRHDREVEYARYRLAKALEVPMARIIAPARTIRIIGASL
jgi:outer membrane protein assembly factor BamD